MEDDYRKKILVVSPNSIYPVDMACKVRIIDTMSSLSEDFEVDVAFLTNGQRQSIKNTEDLKAITRRQFPIQIPNDTWIKRKIIGAWIWLKSMVTLNPREYYYTNFKCINRKLKKILRDKQYDVLLIEYWFQCGLMEGLKDNIVKIVDTHDVLSDKIILRNKGQISTLQKQRYRKYLNLETKNIGKADLVISISEQDHDIYTKRFPNLRHLLMPMGKDIKKNSKGSVCNKKGENILFYGGMGSEQNIGAFNRFWSNIYPYIKIEMPNIKCYVVGSNPPDSIKTLHDGKNVFVTGFVDNVRDYIQRCDVMILPLGIGTGFRGRVLDVMGLGVPVIGTHNALDCMGMQSGVHGFISDSDHEMAKIAVNYLSDNDLRKKMSQKCQEFIIEKYSIEKTYKKLNATINEMIS